VLDEQAPDVRLINLETSVTTSDDFAAGKGIHYRMHPHNVSCLTALRPDACALANNHVLDFGAGGLTETLDTLDAAGLRPVGAGHDEAQAWRPVALDVGGHRVLIWSVAARSSGVPPDWAASGSRAGVALLPEATPETAATVTARLRRVARPGDVVVVSIHWGSNWGYEVPAGYVDFAHALIDAGVHIVHGHSSHHPRPVETYRGGLVLYGCGDLIDDYEGISGYEEFRDDLRLLYLATLDPCAGALTGLRLVPMQVRRMRLRRADAADAEWLCDLVNRISEPFGTRFTLGLDGAITLRRP
jgi:poly-gamma-glutamate synthesis protein (capsule biosynthesis protein)